MKKNMKLFIALAIILLITNGFTFVISSKKNNFYEESTDNIKKRIIQENTLSMMLETEAGSGNYEMTTASSWPTDGYVFNTTLSKCENGGELSWDDENKRVVMSGNVSDKCYVYFDKVLTLATYVKSLYTGTQGDNNIYYHDSSLTNGAKDNSYRYAGASKSVNNYVCFGSTESPCPADNLYRIIGVFDGQVKLIKATKATSSLLGTDGGYVSDTTYRWSTLTECPSDATAYIKNENVTKVSKKNTLAAQNVPEKPAVQGCNEWKYSTFNTVNLNTNYLNNIGTTWSNMIENTTWKVSGHTTNGVTPKAMYTAEITNATKTYGPENGTSKIGLMYVSDYGFAASPRYWITTLSNYNESVNRNWMYMGLAEWTITPDSSDSDGVFYLGSNGNLSTDFASNGYGARPVLYLKASVAYAGGSGTQSDPIIGD